MEELEELREQRLTELSKQKAQQKKLEQKQLEAEQQLEAAVKPLLSIEARERLNNVRLVNKELYLSVLQTVLLLKQKRQFDGILSGNEIKMLLEKFAEQKRETKITRK